MKQILFILFLFCGAAGVYAQQPLYKRVLIPANNASIKQLQQLGVTIDHSHRQQNGIEAEISEYELKTLSDHHIAYTVLIDDMTAYYRERNHQAARSQAAIADCNVPAVPVPSHFHLGSMAGYFTLQQMENILDSMALLYPGLITVKHPISSTQSVEGRNIWYVKISDNPAVDENEPEVLYTALHHAREPESLSQLIFFMWHLLENYNTDPEVRATVDNTELFFVPCVNPDGYVYNQNTAPTGGGMWRKNRRNNGSGIYGVDLNRNYGTHWGYDNLGSSPTSSDDTYRGTSAFSEPETQAMKFFCESRHFGNALNAHTFGNDLIYPWSYIGSFYTPDSTMFNDWGSLLTADSRFYFGTCDQTLSYLTNGDSDDWMYGEQTSKSKIMSMTPESGTDDDGFWPPSNRIVGLCKMTFSQNFNLARLAGNYARITDNQDKFIPANGYVKYKLQRLGVTTGNFTVSIAPLSGIVSFGPPKVYTALSQGQTIFDSVFCTLSPALTQGQPLKYVLQVNNGNGIHKEPVTKIYGSPFTLFHNDGSSVSLSFDNTGSWATTTEDFVSGPSSITDSPFSSYSPDAHITLTTKGSMDLTGASYAHLQFYTKFAIEKTYDSVHVLISVDNGNNFSPLCGLYETSPAFSAGRGPIYDGRQKEWVKEDIDLSEYLFSDHVKIRFSFDSDFYDEKDGFYFDDMLVRIIPLNITGISQMNVLENKFTIGPNPSSGALTVNNPYQKTVDLSVVDAMGQLIYKQSATAESNFTIDLSLYPAGIYMVKLRSEGEEAVKKIVIEK